MITRHLLIVILIAIFTAVAGTAYAFPNTKVSSIAVGSNPYGIAGNSGYAVEAESSTGYVRLINLTTQSLTQKILAGTNPSMVAVTADGSTAFVSNYGSNNVTAINLSNLSASPYTITVGNGPIGVAVGGSFVFVTNYKDSTFSYFYITATTTSGAINTGSAPIGIAAKSDGSTVYVANSNADTVSVFTYSGSTFAQSATVTVGASPSYLTLSPDGSVLYVSNSADNTISVISTSSDLVVKTITLGSSSQGHPNGLAVTPDGSILMVMNSPAGGITYIQTSDNSIASTYPSLGTSLQQVFITSNGVYAYITDNMAGTVYVLASLAPQVTLYSTIPSAINNTNNNASIITWSSNMSGNYEAEIGGSGSIGSGTALTDKSGYIPAGQTLTTTIYASDFNLVGGNDGTYTIYIYVTNAQGYTGYAFTNVTLLTIPPAPPSALTAAPGDSKAFLTWTASTSANIKGYKVYFSTSTFGPSNMPNTVADAGNTKSYTLKELTDGTLYYIAVRTYDIATNESGLSNMVSVTPVYIPGPAGLAGQKGNCFIATAAYGAYDDFDVWVLRQFRDDVLAKSSAGRWFIKTYYATSPPLAHFIAGHDFLRAVVRVLLKPLVFATMIILYTTPVQKVIIFLEFISIIALISGLLIRRRKHVQKRI